MGNQVQIDDLQIQQNMSDTLQTDVAEKRENPNSRAMINPAFARAISEPSPKPTRELHQAKKHDEKRWIVGSRNARDR